MINSENFSVKFEAFIKIPISGEYIFYTESDDGNSLYLNDNEIISHMISAPINNNKPKSFLISNMIRNKKEVV